MLDSGKSCKILLDAPVEIILPLFIVPLDLPVVEVRNLLYGEVWRERYTCSDEEKSSSMPSPAILYKFSIRTLYVQHCWKLIGIEG